MPELPEVEIARRNLAHWTLGQRVRGVWIESEQVLRPRLTSDPRQLLSDGLGRLQRIVGRRSTSLTRVGKRIGWDFEGEGWLVHLGMTGRWVRREPGGEARFGRLRLELDDAWVWFCDARRFGCLAPADDLPATLREGLGPDALLEPPGGEELEARLTGRSAIKARLMDQARLAGVGNIQAVEALWRARVSPFARASSLDPAQWSALAEAIPVQLQHTIAVSDAPEIAYMTDGAHVDNPFEVYGRADEACRRCGGTVCSARQGGRVTYWCPGCQPGA